MNASIIASACHWLNRGASNQIRSYVFIFFFVRKYAVVLHFKNCISIHPTCAVERFVRVCFKKFISNQICKLIRSHKYHMFLCGSYCRMLPNFVYVGTKEIDKSKLSNKS